MGTTSDKLNKILSTKNAIKNAIINKGVNIDSSLPFSQYASKISEIQGEISNIGFNSIEKLDNEWKYKLINSVSNLSYSSTAEADKNFDDISWSTVTIPHDWSIYNEFNPSSKSTYEGGYLDGGDSWYRKKLTSLTDNSKRVFVYFDGVYKDCDVYINGTKIGSNKWYNPFYFDITSNLIFDGNDVLAVFVRNNQPSSRWYSGSGIIRNVYLLTGSKVAFGINDIVITSDNLENEIADGIVNTKITSKINNESGIVTNATVKYSISFNGNVINSLSESVSIASGESILEHTLQIPNPKLWDEYKGNIYKVNIELISNNEIIYSKTVDYGYRYIKYDKDGFYLNGRKIKLKGVCLHHDLGCIGSEVYYSAIERQIKIMKNMGVNAIRITHNPASSEILDICSKEGVLVIEELFDCWTVAKKPNDFAKDFNDYYQSVVETTVKRGINNPSIIMWSLGNEIIRVSNYSETEATTIITNLVNAVKSIDTSRPTTMGDDTPNNVVSLAVMDVIDIIGVNYGSDSEYVNLRNAKPNRCIYGSETTSALSSRGIYVYDNVNLQCPSFDNKSVAWGDIASTALKRHMDSDYLAGMFVWTGFDYIGEPTPFNKYPARSSYFGIVDLAGFPKDIYYMYQSRWTSDPMIHVFPHWTYEGGTIKLWVYSNCYKVELFLNGVSQGSKLESNIGNKYQHEYSIIYEAGTVVANGYDKNDNLIAQDVIYTSYSPNKLILKPDKSIVKNDDLIFVECDIADINNTICPTSSNEVTFTCTNGVILGTDNGDPTDVSCSLRNNTKKAFNGKCLCVIKPDGTNNDIVVTATSSGLVNGTATVKQGKITAYKNEIQTFVDASNPPVRPPQPINLTSIVLSENSISIPQNGSATLTPTLYPSNATQRELVWSSTPEGFVLVDNGTITPITTGNCVVKCASVDNPSIYDECSVEVTQVITLVDSIILDKSSLSLSVGETTTINATVSPSDATNKSLTWESNNANIAITPNDTSCNIEAITDGTSTITVSSNDGSNKSAICNVTIASSSDEDGALYSLNNTTFDGTDGSQVIVTDIAPFTSETGFTVYSDFTISPDYVIIEDQTTVFQFMKEVRPWGGITVNKDVTDPRGSDYIRVVSGPSKNSGAFGAFSPGSRYRLSITWEGHGYNFKIKYIKDNDVSISSKTLSGAIPATPSESIIVIGGYLDSSNQPGRLFKGTISKFRYYNSVLTDEEISNLFGV